MDSGTVAGGQKLQNCMTGEGEQSGRRAKAKSIGYTGRAGPQSGPFTEQPSLLHKGCRDEGQGKYILLGRQDVSDLMMCLL